MREEEGRRALWHVIASIVDERMKKVWPVKPENLAKSLTADLANLGANIDNLAQEMTAKVDLDALEADLDALEESLGRRIDKLEEPGGQPHSHPDLAQDIDFNRSLILSLSERLKKVEEKKDISREMIEGRNNKRKKFTSTKRTCPHCGKKLEAEVT